MPRSIYMSGRARTAQNEIVVTEKGVRIPLPGTEDPFAKAKEEEERRIAAAKAEAEEYKLRCDGLQVTVDTLRTALEAAREESANLRTAAAPAVADDALPTSVTVVSIDGITRAGKQASLACCVDIDGTIGDTTVVLSIESLRLLLKAKTRKPA